MGKNNAIAGTVNHYTLIEPFQNKNAGFSMWTFCQKFEKQYFIKKFLDCVYTTSDDMSSEFIEQNHMICDEYEKKKRELYNAVNRLSDPNVVHITDFFRYESNYYMVQDKINSVPFSQVLYLNGIERLQLCMQLARSLTALHSVGIVHADIKETNILMVKQSNYGLVGKIIDLDCSFFEFDPPTDPDALSGDQIYLSPEACKFICEEPVCLTCKMDVFAFGILFHQILTGKLPEFDASKYNYVFEAVLDGGEIFYDETLSPALKMLLDGMLKCDVDERWTSHMVLCAVDEIIRYNRIPNFAPQKSVQNQIVKPVAREEKILELEPLSSPETMKFGSTKPKGKAEPVDSKKLDEPIEKVEPVASKKLDEPVGKADGIKDAEKIVESVDAVRNTDEPAEVVENYAEITEEVKKDTSSLNQEYVNQGYVNPGYANFNYANQSYSNQGYANQGYANQGYVNQYYANSGYQNQEYINPGYANSNYTDQNNANQSYTNPSYVIQGYANAGYQNQEYMNQGYVNQGYANAGYQNQEYMNQDYANQVYANLSYVTSGYQNQDNLNPKKLKMTFGNLENAVDDNQKVNILDEFKHCGLCGKQIKKQMRFCCYCGAKCDE